MGYLQHSARRRLSWAPRLGVALLALALLASACSSTADETADEPTSADSDDDGTTTDEVVTDGELPPGIATGILTLESTDGTAFAGSRAVFTVTNTETGDSILVPVNGAIDQTREQVVLLPGTYEVASSGRQVAPDGSYSVRDITPAEFTFEASDDGPVAATVEFGLDVQRVPFDIRVGEVTESSVELTWASIEGVDVARYSLRRSSGNEVASGPDDGLAVELDQPTATAVVASGLDPGVKYTFTLFAVSSDGESLAHRSVSVNTPAADGSVPAYALAPNTIVIDDFDALDATALGSGLIGITLGPDNGSRSSSSAVPGIDGESLDGGCVVGQPVLVSTDVAGEDAFYGLIDSCPEVPPAWAAQAAEQTAVVNTDVPLAAVVPRLKFKRAEFHRCFNENGDVIPDGAAEDFCAATDSDGDGVSDTTELALGLNPNNGRENYLSTRTDSGTTLVTVGNAPIDRAIVDSHTNHVFVDATNAAPIDGFIREIAFYAKETGTINFVVVNGSTITYVSEDIVVTKTGRQAAPLLRPATVNSGDHLGYFSAEAGIVPFDTGGSVAKWGPAAAGGPKVGNSIPTGTGTRTYSMQATIIAALPVPAAVVIGNSPTARANVELGSNSPGSVDHTVVDTNNSTPFDGVIEEVTFYAQATGTINIVMVKDDSTITYVSQDIPVTQTGVQTTTLLQPAIVAAGDHIGFFSEGTGVIPYDNGGSIARYEPHDATERPTVGQKVGTFELNEARIYSLQATVLSYAQTVLGNEPIDRLHLDTGRSTAGQNSPDFTRIDTNNSAPFDGYIEEFTFYAKATGADINFVVVDDDFLITYVSPDIAVTRTGIQTVWLDVPAVVQSGDNLGIFQAGFGVVPYDRRGDGGASRGALHGVASEQYSFNFAEGERLTEAPEIGQPASRLFLSSTSLTYSMQAVLIEGTPPPPPGFRQPLSAKAALAAPELECEKKGKSTFTPGFGFGTFHEVDFDLNLDRLKWDIEAGVTAYIDPEIRVEGGVECSVDFKGATFQLVTTPVPVNLELKPVLDGSVSGNVTLIGPRLELAFGIKTEGLIDPSIEFCGWFGIIPCGADVDVDVSAKPIGRFSKEGAELSMEGQVQVGVGIQANLGVGFKESLGGIKAGFGLTMKPLVGTATAQALVGVDLNVLDTLAGAPYETAHILAATMDENAYTTASEVYGAGLSNRFTGNEKIPHVGPKSDDGACFRGYEPLQLPIRLYSVPKSDWPEWTIDTHDILYCPDALCMNNWEQGQRPADRTPYGTPIHSISSIDQGCDTALCFFDADEISIVDDGDEISIVDGGDEVELTNIINCPQSTNDRALLLGQDPESGQCDGAGLGALCVTPTSKFDACAEFKLGASLGVQLIAEAFVVKWGLDKTFPVWEGEVDYKEDLGMEFTQFDVGNCDDE